MIHPEAPIDDDRCPCGFDEKNCSPYRDECLYAASLGPMRPPEHPNPVDIPRGARATESHREQLAQGCAMVPDGESQQTLKK